MAWIPPVSPLINEAPPTLCYKFLSTILKTVINFFQYYFWELSSSGTCQIPESQKLLHNLTSHKNQLLFCDYTCCFIKGNGNIICILITLTTNLCRLKPHSQEVHITQFLKCPWRLSHCLDGHVKDTPQFFDVLVSLWPWRASLNIPQKYNHSFTRAYVFYQPVPNTSLIVGILQVRCQQNTA
jgi:hypothetical protein